MGVRTKHKDATTAEIEERRGKALDLRRSGASLRRIAAQLGVSHVQVRNDIQDALNEAIKENVNNAEALRTMEIERLDDMLLRIAPQINAGNLGAIDRAIRISEQRSKLLGLYAPIKQEIRHTWEDESVALIKSGMMSYKDALETFDHDDTLVRRLFAKAEIPISVGEDQGD